MNLYSNMDKLQRALDVSSTRQNVITNNIANVDTPGYKTMEVSFEDILEKEKMKFTDSLHFEGYRTHPNHIPIGKQNSHSFQPKVIVQNQFSMLNNENNVDIEYEMTKLSENNIWYSTLSQIVNKEFSKLRYVITEGRR